MRRRLHKILALILLMAMITGCWDRREIEERISVFAMAIDDHPDGVELSVQVPVPIKIVGSGGGGGGEGGQGAVHNLSAVGKTVSEALSNLQNQASQELFLGHTRLLLISEKVAREKGTEILDALRRHPEARRRLWPLVVTGEAKEALGINVKLAQIPTEYLLDFVENGSNQGRMADTSLGRWFIDQSDPTREPFLNYLHIQPGADTGGQGNQGGGAPGKVLWKGLAVMKGSRMLGSLSREESCPILQIVEKKPGHLTRVTCPKEKGMIVFQPKEVDSSVSLSHHGKQVNIRVKVEVKGGITESTCSKLNLSEEGVLDKVEKWIAEAYEKQARITMRRLQKEFRADVLQFGSIIHAYHPELWKRVDWKRDFPHANIDVRYQVSVRNLSLEFR